MALVVRGTRMSPDIVAECGELAISMSGGGRASSTPLQCLRLDWLRCWLRLRLAWLRLGRYNCRCVLNNGPRFWHMRCSRLRYGIARLWLRHARANKNRAADAEQQRVPDGLAPQPRTAPP